MKVRESGMPAEETGWIQFFNPENVLRQLDLIPSTRSIADFGCGFGTFSVPAARIVNGEVHAFDIDEDMISHLRYKTENLELRNIRTYLRDFIAEGTGLPDNSMDYVMLFNILHHDQPLEILSEAKRILKKNAKGGIIHWRSDIETPRGPSLTIRPTPDQCRKWAEEAGFEISREMILEPYHFGLVIVNAF